MKIYPRFFTPSNKNAWYGKIRFVRINNIGGNAIIEFASNKFADTLDWNEDTMDRAVGPNVPDYWIEIPIHEAALL